MKKKNTFKISLRVLVICFIALSLVSITNTQAAEMSQLTLLSSTGTDIYIDSTYIGHSYGNYYLTYVSYGTHTVRVTSPKYYDFVKTIYINSKISSVFVDQVPISMSPAPTPTSTPIKIISPTPTPIPYYKPAPTPVPTPVPVITPVPTSPVYMLLNAISGANVYVDNIYSGTIPAIGSLKISMSTGTHSLKLTKQGYQDYLESINANSYLMYNYITMTPTFTQIPAPIPNITPAPTTTPTQTPTPVSGNSVYMLIYALSGTSVYVDNVYSGTIQAAGSIKIPMSTGAHMLKLTKQGYQDHVESINANSYLMYNYITMKPIGS